MYIRIRSQWGVMRTNIHKEQKTLIAYFTIKGYSRRKVFMVSKVYLSMVNIPEEQAGMLALQFPGPSHKPSCFWPLSLCSASRYIHNFVQPVTYAFSSVAWRHRQSAYSIIVNGTFVYRRLNANVWEVPLMGLWHAVLKLLIHIWGWLTMRSMDLNGGPADLTGCGDGQEELWGRDLHCCEEVLPLELLNVTLFPR